MGPTVQNKIYHFKCGCETINPYRKPRGSGLYYRYQCQQHGKTIKFVWCQCVECRDVVQVTLKGSARFERCIPCRGPWKKKMATDWNKKYRRDKSTGNIRAAYGSQQEERKLPDIDDPWTNHKKEKL